MKKFLGILALSFSALFLVSAAHAQVGVTSTGSVTVNSVSVGGSGDVFIQTAGNFVNRCDSSNGSTYLLPNTHNAVNSLLAILLTAQASGSQVSLTLGASCIEIGQNTFNQVVNIAIQGS